MQCRAEPLTDYGDAIRAWQEQQREIRSDGQQWNTKTASKMVQKELEKNPPSLYNVGDKVRAIVHLPQSGKRGKSKKGLPLSIPASITEADQQNHIYKV